MTADPGSWPAVGIYAGRPRPYHDGTRSGIVKAPIDRPVWLSATGLESDEQADRVHHGGPERALSHYPAEHLAFWRRELPQQAAVFVPGVLGENLSTEALTESDVGVGDIFAVGQAVVQVTQPRQPCWKVNRRCGVDDLSRRMVAARRTGWLYRVLEPGWIDPEARLRRVERRAGAPTLTALWEITVDAEATVESLRAAAATPGLAAAWRLRLNSRADWLERRRR